MKSKQDLVDENRKLKTDLEAERRRSQQWFNKWSKENKGRYIDRELHFAMVRKALAGTLDLDAMKALEQYIKAPHDEA